MSNWNDFGFIQQGWQCSVCGAVYSPTTPMCYNCTGKERSFTVSTGTFETNNLDEYLKQYGMKQVKEDKPKYNPDYENWDNEFRNG